MSAVLATITADPIDPARLEALVRHPAAGATVAFTGVVRDHDAGRQVVALYYEAHPDAQVVLADLLTAWLADHPKVYQAGVTHREGMLAVGEVALCVAVCASHRSEAFAACADLVDTVKRSLPVWKRQHFADGATRWAGVP